MQRVYSAPNASMIHLLRDVLEQRGIEAVVLGESLPGGAGELPPNETWIELHVVHDEDADLATRVVDETLQPDTNGKPSTWTCPECGERMEAQFGACWNCGTTRPPETRPGSH